MSDDDFDPDVARVEGIFDAAEEYAPFVDDLVEKHGGQALAILLMLATNICYILEAEAKRKGIPMPAIKDDWRRKMDASVEAIVEHGPAYTGKLLLSAVRWTSREIKEAQIMRQAENIAKGGQHG